MLHESLCSDEATERLQAAWSKRSNLRIAPFLEEQAACEIRDALRGQPHDLLAGAPTSDLQLQYWRYAFVPEHDCDHVLCRFGRWLRTDAVEWAARITGLPLIASPDEQILATLYTHGCYLDAHNDYDGRRGVAYVVGLSPDPIPAEVGGHLEFLSADAERVHLAERRAPGWNTVDLFSVVDMEWPHRIPIVREQVERRAVSGWFFRAESPVPTPAPPDER